MNKVKKTEPQLRLRISPRTETIVRGGHPWLFSESIRDKNREGRAGELAVIYDRNDSFLAIGLYDPHSPIRVRILHSGKPVALNEKWWQTRLAEALARRNDLFDGETTGYRCIHGENDGWPGLVMDRYGSTFVLKVYTAAWFPWLEKIIHWISQTHPQAGLVLRLSRNIQAAAAGTQWKDGSVLKGPNISAPVIFKENSLFFEADVIKGQKTGFFLDQRENRRIVGSLAEGRAVLNAFSFSGGFSLYAARGDASSVTDLDISAHALKSAERNFELNMANPKVKACDYRGLKADVFEWFKSGPPGEFDLIILDPPSLARREVEREEAIQAYAQLSQAGMGRLRSGGVLVAASCSAHVSADEFYGAVRHSAEKSGRKFQELQRTAHPPDHPSTFREAEYLKCIYLQF